MEDYSPEELQNIKDKIVMIVEDDEYLYDNIFEYAEVMPLRFSYDLSSFTEEYISKTKHLFTYYYTLYNFYNNEILRMKKHFKHFLRYPNMLYINKNNSNFELVNKICKSLEIECITDKQEFLEKINDKII